MSESDLVFKVIAHESFPDYTPRYLYAQKTKDSDWVNNELWFDSLEDVARDIARRLTGTKSNYLIISKPLEGKSGVEREGIQGYSKAEDGATIVRKLNEQENRILCGNLARKIREYKIREKVENQD